MSNHNSKLTRFIAKFVFMLLILGLLPILFIDSPFIESILFLSYISASLACAWNILGGYVGPFSIGHSIFFGISAYTTTLTYVHFGFSPWVGMLLGALLAIGFSITIGQLILRLHAHFFALSTIATLLVFNNISSHWVDLTGGVVGIPIPFTPGIQNLTFISIVPYVYLALILLAIITITSYKIMNSKIGFYFLSIREDEDVANALGVNVHFYKTIALSISAFLTALGGAIFVMYSGHITPIFAFSLDRSTDIVVFSVVGGMGTLFGPIIGTFLVVPITQYLRFLFGGKIIGLHYIIYGILLVIVILKFPKGLISLINIQKVNFIRRLLPKIIDRDKVSRVTRVTNNTTKITNNKSRIVENSVILKVKDLTKAFKGLVALKDISFEIKKGEIFGLIGPNGAGKTTLFNLIDGFLKPDYGEVVFCGHNITGYPPYQIYQKSIGRTFQQVKPLRDLTTLENIMVGAFINCKSVKQATDKALQIIDFFDLNEKREQLASSLDIFEQKKLELGKTISGDPQLLLIDEIMAGLNPNETNIMLNLIRQIANFGTTVFLIEHKMKAIMGISDRILVINYGKKIFLGTPKEVSNNELVIEAYLGKKAFI